MTTVTTSDPLSLSAGTVQPNVLVAGSNNLSEIEEIGGGSIVESSSRLIQLPFPSASVLESMMTEFKLEKSEWISARLPAVHRTSVQALPPMNDYSILARKIITVCNAAFEKEVKGNFHAFEVTLPHGLFTGIDIRPVYDLECRKLMLEMITDDHERKWVAENFGMNKVTKDVFEFGEEFIVNVDGIVWAWKEGTAGDKGLVIVPVEQVLVVPVAEEEEDKKKKKKANPISKLLRFAKGAFLKAVPACVLVGCKKIYEEVTKDEDEDGGTASGVWSMTELL